ncbi:MAG: HAMP domain-containing protein [Eubacterium sp.]|nr:HAMP domain-containing protein [Eubacterium sp.]
MLRISHSIRLKISVIVLFSTFLTILISWSVSSHFIEQFYVTHTKNSLVSTYESCNEFFNDVENVRNLKRDKIVSLYGYIENPASASIYVIDPQNFKVYSSVKLNDIATLAIQSLVEDYDVSNFKYSGKKYKIVKNIVSATETENKVGGSYYDLVGLLDNNFVIILRTPLEQVTESSIFTSRLFMVTSLSMLIVELLIVLYISNMFSRPIIEMSRIAKRMSDLDFSARVNVMSNDEIGDLGKSMNDLSSRLEDSIRDLKSANLELSNDIREKEHIEEMRSEFLSHVSHELKTPLAIIQGYAEGIKSGVADDPETMNYYCDVISDEAAKMNSLVMKLIDLNQLETGNDLSIEHFDVTKLIDETIKNSSILLQDKKAEIEFNEDKAVLVWADTFMIEEVITNYLSNAIHYVSDNGKIKVWYDFKKDTVRVNVYNDGQQISDDDLDKLFIKFYKSDPARTRDYGGSGIGLSIVAAIMNAHDKDFGVYNTDTGVVFYFELDTHSEV